MRAFQLSLCSLLLGLPGLGLAQTTDPTYRCFVGVGLYVSSYQPIHLVRDVQVPAQLTVGYQWRPRLAVQVAGAHSTSDYAYNFVGYYNSLYTPPPGNPSRYYAMQDHTIRHHTSLSLLLVLSQGN